MTVLYKKNEYQKDTHRSLFHFVDQVFYPNSGYTVQLFSLQQK